MWPLTMGPLLQVMGLPLPSHRMGPLLHLRMKQVMHARPCLCAFLNLDAQCMLHMGSTAWDAGCSLQLWPPLHVLCEMRLASPMRWMVQARSPLARPAVH